MPMYEFECQKCGHKSEKLMKIDDPSESIKCSKCDGTAIKVYSLSNAHFKGTGWVPRRQS